MRISNSWRGIVRGWGLAAAAIFVLSVAAGQRADAMSPISAGGAPPSTHAAEGLITQVRGGGGHGGGGHGGGGHGGGGFHGGGFHGGGFHGGGFHGGFHGGGFHAGHAFHGGGFRFAHRHHFHGGYYAPYYYDYPHHHCRVIWTHYGPRRVCGYHHWYRHHWRHHHRY
jgi:hypothetical protein